MDGVDDVDDVDDVNPKLLLYDSLGGGREKPRPRRPEKNPHAPLKGP